MVYNTGMFAQIAENRRRVRSRRRLHATLSGLATAVHWGSLLYFTRGFLLLAFLVVGSVMPAVLIVGLLLLLQLPVYHALKQLLPTAETLERKSAT